jgi:hypothetical protein
MNLTYPRGRGYRTRVAFNRSFAGEFRIRDLGVPGIITITRLHVSAGEHNNKILLGLFFTPQHLEGVGKWKKNTKGKRPTPPAKRLETNHNEKSEGFPPDK